MTNKSILLILLLALLSMQRVFCQTDPENSEKQNAFSQFIHNDKVALKLNYFGELGLHPGLEIGTDFTLAKRNWVTVHWDTGLGGYWHRWNNTSLFLETTIGARLPIYSMFIDFNLGAGYMHSFLAGTVYRKSDDGGIEKAPNWGHPHFKPSFSLLIGWDGTRKKNLPFTIYVGPEIYLQSHFNHSFLPHVAAKLGLTYKFKNQ
jgi:hypothetical protein